MPFISKFLTSWKYFPEYVVPEFTLFLKNANSAQLFIKYGDADLPDELIGMTDQYSSFEDHVNIVRKDDF